MWHSKKMVGLFPTGRCSFGFGEVVTGFNACRLGGILASSLFEVKECARLGSPKAEILFQENQEEQTGKEHNGNRNFQELNFTSRS